MKRTLLLISLIALLAGLAAAPSAFGIKAGFNLATERLEAGYKVALFERRFDPQGCYPAPAELAKDIQESSKRKVGVARNTRRLGNESGRSPASLRITDRLSRAKPYAAY